MSGPWRDEEGDYGESVPCDICNGYGFVDEPIDNPKLRDCDCVCHESYRQRENERPQERDYCHGCQEFHSCHFCGGAGELGARDPRWADYNE